MDLDRRDKGEEKRWTIVPSELFDRWKSNRWPWTVEVRLSRLRKPLPFNYRFIFIALLIITSAGQAVLDFYGELKVFFTHTFFSPHPIISFVRYFPFNEFAYCVKRINDFKAVVQLIRLSVRASGRCSFNHVEQFSRGRNIGNPVWNYGTRSS